MDTRQGKTLSKNRLHEAISPHQDLLTEAEAATFLRTSIRKLQRLRGRGEIRFTRVGKTPMYRLANLIEYLDRREVRPTQRSS